MTKDYIENIEPISQTDVAELRRKDAEYGGSWKKRGGVGAFMMLARKWDRIEEQLKTHSKTYDVFDAALQDSRPEGILDDIRDLRRYLLLVEGEVLAREEAIEGIWRPAPASVIKPPPAKVAQRPDDK